MEPSGAPPSSPAAASPCWASRARRHELTAFVVGTSESLGLAAPPPRLAPAPAAPAAQPSAAVPAARAPTASTALAAGPAPHVPAAAPPSHAAVTTIVGAPAVAGAVLPAATTVPAAAPATATPPSAVVARTPAAAPAPSALDRWAEIRGTVHSVAGPSFVMLTDDGQVVLVDVSQLSADLPRALTLGAPVTVYGARSEQRVQAMGFIESRPVEPRPAPKRPAR
jgi:hypothetical protein